MTSAKRAMASSGLKIACAVTMVNALISLCYGDGYCPMSNCGSGGVEIRFPFFLQVDFVASQCYTDYPDLQFYCVNGVSHLNFTRNATLSTDSYEVMEIDYWNQTLSLAPSAPASTCRAFNANRFGGLNITNTTTLFLDCPESIFISCSEYRDSSDYCNTTGGSVTSRWACPTDISSFRDNSFLRACHLMTKDSPPALSTSVTTTVELQFEGNRTLSFQNTTLNSTITPPPPTGLDHFSMESTKSNKKLGVVFGVVAGACGVMFIITCTYCWCKVTRAHMKTRQFAQLHLKKIQNYQIQSTTFFKLKELRKATKNFSNDCKLGSGGFGTVYKGILDNGIEVAIKKTNNVDVELEQYINEVCLLSQVNHRNLVKLHGCCLEVEVPMLVYEYVSNGDLYQHLHNPRVEKQLNWAKRLQIAIDTSEALRYLHFAAFPPIYHRDVKTSNILLDDTFNVKVADFGISKLVKSNASHVSTNVKGTPGYIDPEYFHNFQLTDKSDVYSFGMVLLGDGLVGVPKKVVQ